MTAKIIVLEGIDGSGKTTTVNLLMEKLKNAGKTASTYKFPNYSKPSGIIIKDVLHNKRDIIPDNLFKLFAINRFECISELTDIVNQNDYIVLDRYILSNIIYSAVISKKPVQYIQDEFFELEFDVLKLPKWNKIFLLDISMEHLQKVIIERSETGDANDTNFELLIELDREYKNYFRKNYLPIVPFTDINLRVDLIFDSIMQDVDIDII